MQVILRPGHPLSSALRVLLPSSTLFTEDATAREFLLITSNKSGSAPQKGIDAICKIFGLYNSLPPSSDSTYYSIMQWNHIACKISEVPNSVDVAFLKRVASHLLTHTYLGDTFSPAVCDIFLYYSIKESVARNPTLLKDTSSYPLYRWIHSIEQWAPVKSTIASPTAMPTAAPPAAAASSEGHQHNKKPVAMEKSEQHSGVAVEKVKKADKKTTTAPCEKETAVISQNPNEMFDLVVGKVLSAKKHETADTLYVESIDLGEPSGPRQIVSGLVQWIAEADFQNRLVVILRNLKVAKMRGVESSGMVMCAVSVDAEGATQKLSPLAPPAGCVPGDRITVEGFKAAAPSPLPATIPPKKLSEYLSGLATDHAGVAVWGPDKKPLLCGESKSPISTPITSGIVR